MLYGGIEAGGTKIVCAVGTGPGDLRDEVRFPTSAPDEVFAKIIAFFQKHQQNENLASIGIGSFGPVSLTRGRPDYGFITSTPKPGWKNADLAGTVERALGVPVGFDTDVNVAALGEWRWGAAQGLDTFLYITVGTGVGGGGLSNGRMMHGLVHPEMGHIRIPSAPPPELGLRPFAGNCPFHGDCLEGLTSGPAMKARWLVPAETLPPDHPAWALEAHYLALACVSFICTLSPQRIIIGGGVGSAPQIFPLLRPKVQELLNGYVQAPEIITDAINDYIVPPGLGNLSGVLGAIALAEQVSLPA